MKGLARSRETRHAESLREVRSPLLGAEHRDRLLARPAKAPLATPETEDKAGDKANIILKPHRRGGVGKRGTQIVSADPHCNRPADCVFDSATNCIRESHHGSTQIIGSFYRNRAVHQTDAG